LLPLAVVLIDLFAMRLLPVTAHRCDLFAILLAVVLLVLNSRGIASLRLGRAADLTRAFQVLLSPSTVLLANALVVLDPPTTLLLSCPLGVLFSPALGAFTLSLPPLLSCAPPCSCRARVLVVSIPVLLDPGALVLPGVLTVPLDPGAPVLSFPIPVLLPPGAVVLPLATPAFLARFVTQRTHSSGRRPIRT